MKLNNKARGFITAISLSLMFGLSSLSLQIISLTMKPLVDAGVCDYTQAAAMYSWLTVGSLAATFLGPLLTKKPKMIMLVTGALYIVAGLIYGYVPNIYVIWVASFLLGVCCVTNGYMPMAVIINQWFRKGANTVCTVGSSLHSVVLAVGTPIVGILFASSDILGRSVMAVALTIGICSFILGFFVYKPPEAYGMEPVDLSLKAKDKEQTVETFETAMPIKRVLKTPYIYMAFLGQALIGAGTTAYFGNAAFIFQEGMGISAVQYSYIMSIYSIGNLIIVPIFGVLSDTIGARRAVPIFACIAAASYMCLPLMHGFTGALIGILCLSCTQISNWYSSAVMPKLFGVKKSAQLISWSSSFNCALAIVAPTVFAAIAQANGGSYVIPVRVAGIGLLISAIFTIIITGNKVHERILAIDAPYAEAESNAHEDA